MKKRVFSLLLMLVLLCSLSVTAFAENGKVWHVTFTADNKMTSDFKTSSIANEIADNLQPGDTATFSVELSNKNAKAANWYMSNEVLSTLEESSSSAAGGAYSYLLTYTNPAGTTTVIYNSETVGGDETTKDAKKEREGLEEATSNLEDFFFLDTMASGKSGMVNLTVGLDGETQGNDYQTTLADIQMNFAAEPTDVTETPGRPTTPVKTGDENNLTPYYILMVVSGLLFLYLALDAITDRIYGRKRG